MHKAIFKNCFRDTAGSLCHRHQCHELCLHVGRKSGKHTGSNIHRCQFFWPDDPQTICFGFDCRSGLNQFTDQCLLIFTHRTADQNITTSDRCCNHECSSFNPIGNDLAFQRLEVCNPLNMDNRRSSSFDLRPHTVQSFRELNYFRLTSSILQYRFPFGQRRCHQQIFSPTDRWQIKRYSCPTQFLCSGLNITMVKFNFSSKCFQPLQVQIYWARSDGTATRQTDPGLSKPS